MGGVALLDYMYACLFHFCYDASYGAIEPFLFRLVVVVCSAHMMWRSLLNSTLEITFGFD